jgi:hypothetical protein
LVVVLGLGAYWAYQRWGAPARSAWGFIPDDALLVIESNQVHRPAEKLQPYQVQLTDVPFFEEAAVTLRALRPVWPDSVAQRFFGDKTVTYSLHAETKAVVSYVLYVPYDAEDKPLIEKLVVPDSAGIRSYRHTFENIPITEVFDAQSRRLFAYVLRDGYLIVSPSSLLMENVVRKIKRVIDVPDRPRPDSTLAQAGGTTRLYLNPRNTAGWLGRVVKGGGTGAALLQLLPAEPRFAFGVDGIKKAIQARSVQRPAQVSPYLQILQNQPPQTVSCTRFIPNNTATLVHLGFANAPQVGARLTEYLGNHERDQLDRRADWQLRYQAYPDSAFQYLGREVALCRLESSETVEGGSLLLLHTPDPLAFRKWLDYEAAKIRVVDRTPVYAEQFGRYAIRQLPAPDWPAAVFGRLFGGFPKCYYTTLSDYTVLASDVQSLRTFLTDYQRGSVWNNSTQQQEVLRYVRPAAFTVVFNATKSWYGLLNGLQPDWQAAVERFGEPLRRLNYLVAQSRVQGGTWQTDLTWTKGRITGDPNLVGKLFLQQRIELPAGRQLARAPYLFRHSRSRTPDLVLHTTSNEILPFSVYQKPGVLFPLAGRIRGELLPIEYYGRGRNQLLMLTDSRLYILDPFRGKYQLIESNPIPALPNYQLHVFDRVAPPNRFVLADTDGNYFGYEPTARQLRPMTRQPLFSRAQTPVPTVLIKGIRYLVVLEPDGRLTLVNAAGATPPGFPLDLSARFGGPVFVEANNRTAEVLLQTLSSTGELIKVNLRGEIVQRQQLYRPAGETQFRLLLEKTGRDWLIVQQTNQNVSVHDKRGTRLFNIANFPADTRLDYYDFDSDVKIIALVTGNTTAFYTTRGVPLLNRPVESRFPIVLDYAESYQKLMLYVTTEKAVELWTAKLK